MHGWNVLNGSLGETQIPSLLLLFRQDYCWLWYQRRTPASAGHDWCKRAKKVRAAVPGLLHGQPSRGARERRRRLGEVLYEKHWCPRSSPLRRPLIHPHTEQCSVFQHPGVSARIASYMRELRHHHLLTHITAPYLMPPRETSCFKHRPQHYLGRQDGLHGAVGGRDLAGH